MMMNTDLFRSRIFLLLVGVTLLPSAVSGHSVQIANSSQDIVSDIRLRWLNDRTMQIRWAGSGGDNSVEETQDLIFLTPSTTFPDEEDEEVCRFRGKLENNQTARASIVGCIFDDVTFVNINFDGNYKILKLTKDGNTLLRVKNPSFTNVREKRAARYRQTGGYLETTQKRPNLLASRSGPLPSAITLPYTLGYDFSLRKHFGSDSKAKKYVKDAYVLAEPFLESDSNMGTEVHLKLNNIEYVDSNLNSDNMCDNREDPGLTKVKNSQEEKLTPLVIFAEDKADCDGTSVTTGCAYRDSACGVSDGTNYALVDMTFLGPRCPNKENGDIQNTAMTFVHEVGHMLGMKHDENRDDGKNCFEKGHMSYSSNKLERWSSCSIEDFKTWYNTRGRVCKKVEHGTTNCGGHKAETCKRCGSEPYLCNGECTWDYEARECANQEILRPSFTIRTGAGWKNANNQISNLEEVSGSRVADCEKACVKKPGCVGFTFVSSIDRCDLKRDDQAVFMDEGYADSIISATLKLREGAGWHDENDGINSIKEVFDVDKPQGCESHCRRTPGCVGWTFVLSYNRCDLKAKNDAISYSFQYADVTSGLI